MVRKNIYLSLLVMAAALFVACSDNESDTNPYEEDLALVPIILGEKPLNSFAVKSAIDDPMPDLDSVGIFALAVGKQEINLNPQPIRWFQTYDESQETCCIMDNVKSRISQGLVAWFDESAIYYYPVTQFYRYAFYCNYPYTEDLVYNSNYVDANYTIDGITDLLWGQAYKPNDPYAYSAKYFRENRQNELPNLELQHLLTRLKFHIKPGPLVDIPGATEDDLDYSVAKQMTVMSLQICNAITKVRMHIADYNNLNMSIDDRLIARSINTDTLSLCHQDGENAGMPVDPIQVPAKPSLCQQWGEIMLFPANMYIVRLVLQDAEGRQYVSETPLQIAPKGEGNESFRRGQYYNVVLTIHGPTAIKLSASVEAWTENGEEIGIDI